MSAGHCHLRPDFDSSVRWVTDLYDGAGRWTGSVFHDDKKEAKKYVSAWRKREKRHAMKLPPDAGKEGMK